MGTLKAIVDSIEAQPLEPSAHLYHPIPFEAFNHLSSAVNVAEANKKFQLITNALPYSTFDNRKILDIGANAGFFSYEFASLGGQSDAIEPHPRYYDIGMKVSAHYQAKVSWHNQELNLDFLRDKKYDIGLMLSVFQWISRGNSDLTNARNLLLKVSETTEYLFFELGCNWGKSAIKINGNALPWIANLLRENTIYAGIWYLGMLRPWGDRLNSFRFKRYLFCCSNSFVNLSTWQRIVSVLISGKSTGQQRVL
jgi:hypothetical protein